jgi:hypothetical protein
LTTGATVGASPPAIESALDGTYDGGTIDGFR